MAEEARIPVVLHYRGGSTVRCSLLREFTPAGAIIEAVDADGEPVEVQVDELKAVFFPKDPRRRAAEMGVEDAQLRPEGAALARVEFFDGEVIRGRVRHYSVKDKGFFLYPTAVESNNEKVFVVARSLTTVDLES